MEAQTASVIPAASLPRLRLMRQAVSPIPHADVEPRSSTAQRPSNSKRSSPPQDSHTTSEDEYGPLEHAYTSRLLSASLPPPDSSGHSADTTHRLKALLERFDAPSRSSTNGSRVVMPPSPSEPESDFELRPVQIARASIKDLFQNALREPGDTHDSVPHPHSSAGKHHESRSGSPSSPNSVHTLREKHLEELHERERGWNAPLPKHSHRDHKSVSHETTLYHQHGVSLSPHSVVSVNSGQKHDDNRHHANSSATTSDEGHNSRVVHRSRSPAISPARSNYRHTRPTSSLPPSIKETSPIRRNGVSHKTKWDLPSISSFRGRRRTSSSPSISPSRPLSYSSQSSRGPEEHTLSNTDIKGKEIEFESSPSDLGPIPTFDARKGHRRTTTELSESMGPFPRQNGLPPLLLTPDESDASLFADDSVPPPQTSTPTIRSVHLPDLTISSVPSDVPLLPSPPSPDDSKPTTVTRAESDLARLRKAVAPAFVFPARHSPPSLDPLPNLSPPISSHNTSRPTLAFDAPQLQSETSSPPQRLPGLSDDSCEEHPKTPPKLNGQTLDSLPLMKTPRPPGAFGTPTPPIDISQTIDPTSPHHDTELHTDSKEAGNAIHELQTEDYMQASRIHKGNSASVPPTPVFPGAYYMAAIPAKHKGILKVRFDGDPRTSEDPMECNTGVVSTGEELSSKTQGSSQPPSPSSEDLPPAVLSPSRRKGLRLVDEYGRARRFTEDGEEIMLDTRRKLIGAIVSPESPVVDDMTATPRRRAKMRQVDSLGNEMAGSVGSGSKEEQNEDIPQTRGKKAVLSQLAKSLGELQNDLAQEENALAVPAQPNGLRDSDRLNDLAMVSKSARIERNKINRKLQLEKQAGSTANKNFLGRISTRHLPLEMSERAPWWQRKWKLVILILFLEMTLLFIGYRLAMVHAKRSWLRTHFDPFYPALYLHKSRPSFLSRFEPLPIDWSAFVISSVVGRVDDRGSLVGVAKQIWEEIWSWGLEPWEAWGGPAAGSPVPRLWPS